MKVCDTVISVDEWTGETRAAQPGLWLGRVILLERVEPGLARVWWLVGDEWRATEGVRRIGWPRVRDALELSPIGWVVGRLIRRGGYALTGVTQDEMKRAAEFLGVTGWIPSGTR